MLDAVLGLLKEQGFEGITMALIAKHMGASVGGLYRYYPSKEAVYAALQLRALERFDAHVLSRMAACGEPKTRRDALERVIRYAESWSTFRIDHPHLFAVLDQSLSSPHNALDAEGRALVDERLAPILDRLSTLLDTAVQHAALKPGSPVERTQLLWAAMHGIEHFRKRIADPQSNEIQRLRSAMLSTLLHGWGAAKGLTDVVLPTH